jgi:asparagine synthase (glutamine-hydrolysing)
VCGIVAVIGAAMFAPVQLEAALSLLNHRGPDGGGHWSDDGVWLGHRRLAIIDLSDAGIQPMHVDDAVTITFNGEIYNYIELRKELQSKGHRFRTETDTEVLLHAYLEWGVECLEHLNGMWAFVIWDKRRSQAFIARDRFGVKPLYYSCSRDRVVVASEPKAILDLEPSRRIVDQSTLFSLLADRAMDVTERTFYQGISSLPPGHYALVTPTDCTLRPRRFWNLPTPDEERSDFDEVADEVGGILEDAVRLRYRSDVPVGLTLSGGIDSTAILEAATKFRPDIVAFTSVYGETGAVDERVWAKRAVARHPNVVLNEVDAASEDWLKTLNEIVWHMDGPGTSPAVFPLWEIMKAARKSGVTVLLDGQGADEMFGGYPWHAATACVEECVSSLRHPRALGDALSSVRTAATAFTLRSIIENSVVSFFPPARKLHLRRIGVRQALDPGFATSAMTHQGILPKDRDRKRLDRQLFDDFTRNTLPGFLQYGDAVSMAHSVEIRVPFLDYRLVNLAFSLPAASKVINGQTKVPLRNYLLAAGQPEIANRVDKRGYPTPASEWLAHDNGRLLREVLVDRSSMLQQYFKPHALEKLVENHVAGRFGAGNQMYGLLSTELWLNRCIAPDA